MATKSIPFVSRVSILLVRRFRSSLSTNLGRGCGGGIRWLFRARVRLLPPPHGQTGRRPSHLREMVQGVLRVLNLDLDAGFEFESLYVSFNRRELASICHPIRYCWGKRPHEADNGVVALSRAKISVEIEEFFGMRGSIPHCVDHAQTGIELRSVGSFWPDGVEIWNPEHAFMVGV